jgi:hypothetical protein
MSKLATGRIDLTDDGMEPTNNFTILVKGMNKNSDRISIFTGTLSKAILPFKSVDAPNQYKLEVTFDRPGEGTSLITGTIGHSRINITLRSINDDSKITITGEIDGGSNITEGVNGSGFWALDVPGVGASRK